MQLPGIALRTTVCCGARAIKVPEWRLGATGGRLISGLPEAAMLVCFIIIRRIETIAASDLRGRHVVPDRPLQGRPQEISVWLATNADKTCRHRRVQGLHRAFSPVEFCAYIIAEMYLVEQVDMYPALLRLLPPRTKQYGMFGRQLTGWPAAMR